MINHYFKLCRKVLMKYKYHTFINVFGLVSGMLGALIIAKYVGGSLQFDHFHANRDQIHSISQYESVAGGAQQKTSTTYQGVGTLIAQFPEVLRTTKYTRHVESLVISKNENGLQDSFTENKIFTSDSNFFKVFSFPFVHGNAQSAFSRLNSAVLTQSTSKKYFGIANPSGEVLLIRTSWGHEIAYEVTGVIQDIPPLSRFNFDFLINSPTTNATELWNLPDYPIYVLLKENTDAGDLAQKVTLRLQDVQELRSLTKSVTITLESFSEINLSTTECLLITVGIMVAIICWVNYFNQNIAQAYWRTREIGIRTVLGATKANLRTQFAIESSVVCFTALLLVFASYLLLENYLQSVTKRHLLPLIGDATCINAFFALIFLVGTALAALAPTLVVFKDDFEKSLRNNFTPRIGGLAIRKVFVVLQFSISTVLLVSIFVITGQLHYMNRKDKGINMDNVLIIKAPMAKDTTWAAKMKTLQLCKQQIAELPFVVQVASSTTVPGEEYRQETYLTLQGNDNKVLVHQNGVDENFFSLYKAQFVAGQDFIPNARVKNRESIILNESAAIALGASDYDKLINSKVIDHENPDIAYDVIGVVKDYHQTSLKYEIRPLAFKYNLFRGHCSLKLDSASLTEKNIDDKVASLQDIWKLSYPESSFDYFFLNEKFLAQDEEDEYFGSLLKSFTVLSVVLSCLGLFGLSILISTKRQKEVGVRKTFGATSLDVLSLFMKGYIAPLSVALLLGSSTAYFLMADWLTNYANRIQIGPGLLFSAVFTLIAIFLVTVSYHTIKAAMTNPVKALRN